MLAWQLRQVDRGTGDRRYTAIADDELVIHSAPWTGPVVEAWRQHLTLVDVRQALTLRRVQRLVANGYEDSVREAYQDPHGRYVLVAAMDNGQVVSRAEWPVGLDAVAGWNDKTVLAADDHQALSTLLALTPSEDGVLHADPVPMMPRGGREGFGYGYSGGSPSTTYVSLLRCALGDDTNFTDISTTARAESQLWKAISTTTGHSA